MQDERYQVYAGRASPEKEDRGIQKPMRLVTVHRHPDNLAVDVLEHVLWSVPGGRYHW